MERAELKNLVLATGCAVKHGDFIFMRDPLGSASEQAQLERITGAVAEQRPDGCGWLCIPTGGTSGGTRFARHDEQTLSAAVGGFRIHYGLRQVNALDVLPAYHVSGLMARIRCAETGGELVAWSWRKMEMGEWPALPTKDDGWFLSLVPTQLQRLLARVDAVARLREFRVVFIGGGPLWAELAEAAAAARVPVAMCYGMTETAAMVVAQKAGVFLAGDRSCGQPMPHAKIEIVDEVSGAVLPRGATGLVRIAGENIYRGYWPGLQAGAFLQTEDLGCFDASGNLTIFGRRDAVIITGGEKVHPVEVETVLRSSGAFEDVAVIGVPDPEWGSAVVACHPPCGGNLDTLRIGRVLETLTAYKRPKRFVEVSPWPRNAQGKLNRAALMAAVTARV